MSQDGSSNPVLPPPALSTLMNDAGRIDIHKIAMERTFSQDIQEGTQDLKEAAEQTRNIILDLNLDGVIRWVSPSWTDVVGTELSSSNDSKSQFVKFSVKIGTTSEMAPMLPVEPAFPNIEEQMREPDDGKEILELEGQGIMVYDRVTGGESHTMWMLQPATEPLCIEFSLPQKLVDSLGIGAEILAKYLTELAEDSANDPENHPPPLPVLCRVCERSIVPWWFEKHSDLCVQEHKAELDVQMVQESLTEHRNAIVKVLDAFEARQGRPRSHDASPVLLAAPEYKGMPIGASPPSSTAVSSGPASQAASPARSGSPSNLNVRPSHNRSRSFIVRRPLVRIVELVLDLCDTAIEINVPSLKEEKLASEDFAKAQSPQSESRISQVLQWQQPSSLEHEAGLSALAQDTERLAKAKVEAVHRHQVILEYAERIRQEYMAEVDACIQEALIKADRARAGESFSSSDSEMEENELPVEGSLSAPVSDEPTPLAQEPTSVQSEGYVGMKSMASALRNPLDLPALSRLSQRRPSSQAVSTGSSSPAECPTPKSHKGPQLSQPQPVSNRRSMYAEDGNDSDGSMASSNLPLSQWRSDSPAASDHGLGRTASSRERKRRSMHLHGLGSASPHRQHSPGRYPPPPPSPLRLTKSRIPSGELAHSPIVSPLLTAGEFMPPPETHSQHHRRQSSIHSSDVRGGPPSPRLHSITAPQERVLPPSIKDFEVIKPISKGAFGSVYLSKKKRTGEYFAIKVLRKSDMVAKNQVTNVKAERAIMMWQGESDFVAKLYWTFSSKDYLYLVMEYLNGGDCASLIKILGGLSEDWAMKYTAEVVLGVQHLHSRGIVHRDLKPDNLLIDSKGHLKLTDFGLSRMGLVGRQKRALKQPDEAPDLLKQGIPFKDQTQSDSNPTSRSASFDYHGGSVSPMNTPLMTPALAGGLDQPSKLGLHDAPYSHPSAAHSRSGPIEEEAGSQGSASPDLFPLSQSMSNISHAPAPLPPVTALFDPEEGTRRFVGTPDYLAPETIKGAGQDEMCDWWSLGCIVFEFLFGVPPFNAESTDEVFDNILHRRIAWPDEEEYPSTDEVKDLINCLIQMNPQDRLGANKEDKFPNGGAEIQAHSWFTDINWETLLEDEAQFVPAPEHPEDTEYFDARGATLSSFPEELEDQLSPTGHTPGSGGEYERPHDALFRTRTAAATGKRGLMPLHIPPHVARDTRSRRLSEPVVADDFGNFTYKNLPVLEKANKDIVEKMRRDTMQAQARGYASQVISASNTPNIGSPAPSLESSPMVPMPVKRALSISKGHRPASPSGLNLNASPSRPSQPSSPLLLQFSTAQNHERRKTSGSSQASSGSMNAPTGFFDSATEAKGIPPGTSPNKPLKATVPLTGSPAKSIVVPQRSGSLHSRTRSQTVGSQDGGELQSIRESFAPGHHKRKSQLFNTRDLSPSSSDNEAAQQKALLKVQRRRQSSRRMSQFNLMEGHGPTYRPLDILIVEDHPVSKMVMEKLIEKLRCRTITAGNGPDALRLAVSQIQFDIIFMEYKLPTINGIDVARMIRDTKSANTSTPIICMTNYLKDLPETHHFDGLMLKPPTIPKLTEELCKFCSWKPPHKDMKMTMPLTIPTTSTRHDHAPVQDSPSSVASSLAPTFDSSWKGSSREDSIGSAGFFSDLESVKADEIPVIVSRAATDEWARGLGITGDQPQTAKAAMPHPQLLHTESAPPTAPSDETLVRSEQPSAHTSEARVKRRSIDKSHLSAGGPEEGDDEDDELGHNRIGARSPMLKSARTASKLGVEMMRTNSRGSVISMNDEGRVAEPETLRKSLELLEGRMESLTIPEEPLVEASTTQPRKLGRTASYHSHPDPEEVRGHITPPEIFPQKPGHTVADIDMDAELTPMPTKIQEQLTPMPSKLETEPVEQDEPPTPRAVPR
ncbi:Serine/threonine-protein kinase cek1 [Cyphellophora attinorum]|uniref:non-specific serine/threonine protein kinase n=1 Tax=Cyphellophora attinorum TaxID=1664694 RepID=A0A0N1P1C6_9EURO|nr:Serine/threonine-protein kinase cek1 [Phialophora attinorum]KPI44952.1 Serine/threonine-protein kinase cek1 [Phialophora attinorum]